MQFLCDDQGFHHWPQSSGSVSNNPEKTLTEADFSQGLVQEIENIYHSLSKMSSLAPTPHLNSLFTRLVQIATSTFNPPVVKHILFSPKIEKILRPLRTLCSTAEYHLEMKWSNDLKSFQAKESITPEVLLSRFIYYKNYDALTCLELSALQGVCGDMSHVAFIGCGPLPLSSILMARKCSNINRIDNIDVNPLATQAATELTERLGMEDRLKYYTMDAASYGGYGQADVIVLAALVGETYKDKMDFLKLISSQMKPGALILTRSAHSLRKLLYVPIEPFHVNSCGLQTLVVSHPQNEIVNSILIAKRA
ncbi:Nicotianamine synthase [Phycomyces nitens]|nr:Nicotianamine synthase [Phycomyces nitens]